MLKSESPGDVQPTATDISFDRDDAYLKNLRERLLFASPSKEDTVEDARTHGCNI